MNKIQDVWQKVLLARHPKRPTASLLIKHVFPDFIELHGDRNFGDDTSIIGGIATFHHIPVTIIAQEKGTNTDEKIKRNFGMPHPEGYRKALRLMKQAEKFNRPIILIIDTPGAYPGIGAEERGQSQAIAFNLFEMIDLHTPLIGLILSEGGSGGALAIGVTDHLMMLDNSIYSIISPEGFASILFKDSTKAKEAANFMKLTAEDLKAFGIASTIIKEPTGGFHEDIPATMNLIDQGFKKALTALQKLSIKDLLKKRYDHYRHVGIFEESKEKINE